MENRNGKISDAATEGVLPPWREAEIERFGPFDPLGKKKILPIEWHEIHPTIRWLKGDRRADCGITTRTLFDYLLVFFLDGKGIYTVGDEDIKVQEHLLILVPPFTNNSYDLRGNHFFTSIHFDWKPNFPSARRLPDRKPYQVQFPSDLQIPSHQILVAGDPLVVRMQQILELWQDGSTLSRLHANVRLAEVLITLLKRAETKESSTDDQHTHVDQKRIEVAIVLMQEKLLEDLSLEAMARAAGLSVGHFSHLFRKFTGQSPVEYLIKLRIERAKELIEDIGLTIKQVSHYSGFKDYSHFSKLFTRFTGVSPSQYREMVLVQRGA